MQGSNFGIFLPSKNGRDFNFYFTNKLQTSKNEKYNKLFMMPFLSDIQGMMLRIRSIP